MTCGIGGNVLYSSNFKRLFKILHFGLYFVRWCTLTKYEHNLPSLVVIDEKKEIMLIR